MIAIREGLNSWPLAGRPVIGITRRLCSNWSLCVAHPCPKEGGGRLEDRGERAAVGIRKTHGCAWLRSDPATGAGGVHHTRIAAAISGISDPGVLVATMTAVSTAAAVTRENPLLPYA